MQVEPKRQELAAANDKLLAANTRLKEVQEKVAALNAQVKQLEDQYSLVSPLPWWWLLYGGKSHCSLHAHNPCQQLIVTRHAVGESTMQVAILEACRTENAAGLRLCGTATPWESSASCSAGFG